MLTTNKQIFDSLPKDEVILMMSKIIKKIEDMQGDYQFGDPAECAFEFTEWLTGMLRDFGMDFPATED